MHSEEHTESIRQKAPRGIRHPDGPTRSRRPAIHGAHPQPALGARIEWTIGDQLDARLLFDNSNLRWGHWLSRGSLHTVKHGPHRTVYRLTLPHGEFYVKHFRVPGWRAVLSNGLQGSPAEREWQAARRIAELGLPTFEPVALGLTRRLGVVGDSYLISRAIPDTLPLDHFLLTEFRALSRTTQAQLRQTLARELGRFAATLHAAGINHVDLHAANILVGNSAAEQLALWLIDLHAVQFRTILSPRVRDLNLAALHQFFAGRSTQADRRRSLLAYEQAMGRERADRSREELIARTDSLEDLLADRTDAGWKRADRAWYRGNRHVSRFSTEGGAARGLATIEPDWLKELARAPELPFERHVVRWCKQTPRCRVAEVLIPCGAGQVHAYWKCRERADGPLHLFNRWRSSPARRAWETGHALIRRGISTPRPLALVEQTETTGRSYLLTAAVENAVSLELFARDHLRTLGPVERTKWLGAHREQLARQLRRLHASRFDHRDLKFSNLLVSNDPRDARIWLLDLDHVRCWRRLPRSRAVQNLSRVAVSARICLPNVATECLRFLKAYLRDRFAAEWKMWWRAIARRSEFKLNRNKRRCRPVS